MTDYNPEYLRIYPPDALDKLQSGDPAWEKMVPPEVVEIIKARGFFGYRAAGAGLIRASDRRRRAAIFPRAMSEFLENAAPAAQFPLQGTQHHGQAR